jgi:hypothetical protein
MAARHHIPSCGTGEISDRHDFQGCHAEFHEVIQAANGSEESALHGKCAYM